MENALPLKVLLVAEGSGGHFIPALQVARALSQLGIRTKMWYVQRPQTAGLSRALAHETGDVAVEVDPIPVPPSRNLLSRLWQCGALWHRAQHCFDTFAPDVVVGFGGWVCAPVVLAAKRRQIGCLLHEQNVVMGRANRLLARWVDQVAVSFDATHATLSRRRAVMTGMPVRRTIGACSRAIGAQRFGFDPARPTLLILGGSQGARPINRLLTQGASLVTSDERQRWQVLHVTGVPDEARVKQAYTASHVTAWVASFVTDMDAAYAASDVVIARAGASTIAELARCGKPAVLIPYPYAGGHQRENARLVEAISGGLMIEETAATPERVIGAARRILSDRRLRDMMGTQMRALNCADAAERLTQAIVELARTRTGHA